MLELLLEPIKYTIPEKNPIKRKDMIVYDDTNHTYTQVNGKKDRNLMSVTTFLGKYKHKFEATEANTASTMRRHGLNHLEVQLLWDNIREVACNRGTYIHHHIEQYIHTCLLNKSKEYRTGGFKAHSIFMVKSVKEYIEICLKEDCTCIMDKPVKEALEFIEKMWLFTILNNEYKELPIVYPEDILYYLYSGLAGQSDLVVEFENFIDIHDYKTNIHELTWENDYQQYYKEPLENTLVSKLKDYQLQLSIYGLFAKKLYKKPIRNLYIHHFGEDMPQTIKVDYVENEVVSLLNHNLKQRGISGQVNTNI